MRIVIVLTCICFAFSPILAKDKHLSAEEKEKLIYEINVKKATDFQAAFSNLYSNTDRDHVVRAILKNGKTVKKNHKLVSVSRFGALLNLKLVDIDDKKEWYMITVRPADISQFILKEIEF